MLYKLSIIGYHAKQKPLRDGQTVKTQQLAKAMKNRLGEEAVNEVDMQGASSRPLGFLKDFFLACRNSEAVIILPAHNALLVFPFLCLFFRKRGVKLFYSVIGGWLSPFLEKHKLVEWAIKRFNGIWVETSVMQNALTAKGFKNISIVPNFKELDILKQSELAETHGLPIRLSIFSRIVEEKGIDDAVNAITEINEARGNVFTLDLYGKIDDSYAEHFSELQKKFPPCIQYKGCVDASKSVETLKEYDALLFPTTYTGEGHPGTIIDAYSAGLPVISAKWHSYADFVEEGVTGVGFEQFDYKGLVELLNRVADSPQMLNPMRPNCLKKAEEYSAETVSKKILEMIK